MNRLPQEFRLIVSREVGEDEWRVDQIMEIVGKEISARERAFIQLGSHAHGTGSGPSTITAMMAGDGKPRCCYCRQTHSLVSCKIVTDVTQRKAILRKAGRCFICLKRHHMSRDYRSLISCSLYSGRHHTSLCKGHDSKPQSVDNRTQFSIPSSRPPPTSEVQTSSTTTGLYCVNADTPVLQTAQEYIHKLDNPACGMNIRLMFDGGSQRSYITERVKEALGLVAGQTEVVNTRTFGSETTRAQTAELVLAAIMLKEGSHICFLFQLCLLYVYASRYPVNQLHTLSSTIVIFRTSS